MLVDHAKSVKQLVTDLTQNFRVFSLGIVGYVLTSSEKNICNNAMRLLNG